MEGEPESLILLFWQVCLNCRWVGSGCVGQKVLYVGLAENLSLFLAIVKKIASARSQRVRGAFTQPGLMGSCLTIIHTCFPFPPSRQISPCVNNDVKVSEDAAWVYTSFMLIASGKSRSAREASHQLAFRGSCLTIMCMCLPYLPNR